MDSNLDDLADKLVRKTKEYLLAQMGRTFSCANDEELYRALVHMMRDEIMANHLATEATFASKDVRRLYYLSMEYLPGRFFLNNLNNIGNLELIKCVLQKINRSLPNIASKENEPGLGNGGLGRLASCLLDSLASQHYPAFGYGLRYQYGIFEQQIRDGLQIEVPDCWLINENPWEIRQEQSKASVKYGGSTTQAMNFHGDCVQILHDYEEVWAMPYDLPIIGYKTNSKYSVLTLRLWSTKESPRNFQLQRYNAGKIDQAAENMLISDVLYPNELNDTGKRIRLKQEYLLVSASLQDIIQRYLSRHDTFNDFADKVRIQINDTHPALLIAELIRILNKERNMPWGRAVDITREVTSYTNHTILKEALEEWDAELMKQLLPRQFNVIEKLNHEFCQAVRRKCPDDEARIRSLSILEYGKVRMANLSIIGSHKVNGVSEIHTSLLKQTVFKDFYNLFPDRFVNITNGVTQRLWLLQCNPSLAEFITKRIGDGWITDFEQIEMLKKFADCSDSQKEFWEIRKKNKDRLISFLKRFNKIRNASGKVVGASLLIDNESLFDMQIKRIHEYKRQLMNALHLLMLYHDITDSPNGHNRIRRACFFAGKTAGGYETAKEIIRLIFAIAKKLNLDPVTRRQLQVVFIENYNVSKAELLIPAADISEQISLAGTEASGTSVMKFAMNGALTVATHDGANVEINRAVADEWWPFSFGLKAEDVASMRQNHSYSSSQVCEKNPKIKRVLNCLIDHSLAKNASEHSAFCHLYQTLLEAHDGESADRYFVLQDLQSFYEIQKRVEELFCNPSLWAKTAIHTIASMGRFSIDHSVKQYCEEIWGLTSCPSDHAILDRIRHENGS